jgi:uncharacterized CHY-type Zn-finger protein
MDILNDNMSIISDISDPSVNDTNSTSDILPVHLLDSLTYQTKENLNQLNLEGLKEKCKEHSITSVSKLKKNELIQLLLDEFVKLINMLKDKKATELRSICKYYKLKCNVSSRKDRLIITILTNCSTTLKFKLEIDETNIIIDSSKNDVNAKANDVTSTNNVLDLLEKQRQEIELKMKEEIEKQKKIDDEIKRLAEEEEKKKVEEQNKKEKEEAKKKKQTIPKQVRVIVWNHYIGDDIIKHKCLCCKKVTITNTNFDVGHVLSEKNGGTHEINNLRPICGACNHSMGSENMIDFVVKYGLYIG